MKVISTTCEIQFDEKPNGVTIRINDHQDQCIFRMCQIPRELVFDGENVKKHIDLVFSKTHYTK